MKTIVYYVPVILGIIVMAFCINSCKKDPTSLQKTATVSTVATGYYTSITVDKSGNIYALRIQDPDTIFRITQSGGKSVFYVPPTTIDHDTVEHHPMQCLTTDSAGNIYTIAFNGITHPDVLKITPTGTATTLYTNISMAYFQANAKIALDAQGNLYYPGNNTLYKISPGGALSTVLTAQFVTFTPDVYGNIYYTNMQNSIQKLSTTGTTSTVGAGKILGDVYDLGADVYGDVFVSSTSDGGMLAIQKLNKNDSVKTVISCISGHADGPVNKAQISSAVSQVTDATGNLYFMDSGGIPWYIRKITF